MPGMEVFDRVLGDTLCEPVGAEQREVELPGPQAAALNGSVIEIVNAERDQLHHDASIDGFKKMSFFLKGVLKVRIVAECNAERGHRTSGTILREVLVF